MIENVTLSALPKVELHIHLDCSLSYQVVRTISPDITFQIYQSDFIAPEKCKSLSDFLSCAASAIGLMQTREHLQLVVRDLFDQLASENVIYAEIRFAPLLHTSGGLQPEEIVESVADAVVRCIEETGVRAGIILCTLRHYSEKQSMETVKLVRQCMSSLPLVGFDLAADEAGFPIEAHKKAFLYAIRHDIPRTAHAGEARGPASIWETLEHLQPARIGHGVRCIEDPKLVEHIAASQIHLEVCPSCNIQTNIFDTYCDHPVDVLYRSGVSLGINTDARTLVNMSLSQEYQTLIDVFNWSVTDLLQCNMNAVDHSFADQEEKKILKDILRSAYGKDSQSR